MAPLHILYKVTTELHKQSSPSQFTEKEKRIGWLRLVRPGLIDTDDPEKLKPDAHLALQAKLLGTFFILIRDNLISEGIYNLVQTSQKYAKSLFFNCQTLNVSNFLLFDQ